MTFEALDYSMAFSKKIKKIKKTPHRGLHGRAYLRAIAEKSFVGIHGIASREGPWYP